MSKALNYSLIICLISFIYGLKACADDYLLTISGENLNKVAALKINLDIKPNEFCELDEAIDISNQNISFKSVNKQGSLLAYYLKTQKMSLEAKLISMERLTEIIMVMKSKSQ